MSEKPVASIKTLARYKPGTVYIGTGEYVAECVRADDGDYYLAADVDAAIEALRQNAASVLPELVAVALAACDAVDDLIEKWYATRESDCLPNQVVRARGASKLLRAIALEGTK